MTRYRVPISPDLLEQAGDWPVIRGFRLVSIDGPWPKNPAAIICTCQDNLAPARFEGRLVEITVREMGGYYAIAGIDEIPFPGPLPAPSQTPWKHP